MPAWGGSPVAAPISTADRSRGFGTLFLFPHHQSNITKNLRIAKILPHIIYHRLANGNSR
ncbi:hypothetical protein QUA04_27300 [Microcoleus sp. S13_C5]